MTPRMLALLLFLVWLAFVLLMFGPVLHCSTARPC